MMPVHAGSVASPVQPSQPSPVRLLLMTDDLLVATQGGAQRDVRAVVGTLRATPSRCRRPITARLRGQACRFSWRPWESGSLEALELLGVWTWAL